MKSKEKLPLVSIIIPLYNAESFIIETLESVKRQSYGNYEVIIVDNVSTDNGCDIVKEFIADLDGFQLLQTDANSGGPAHPRNVGIEHSRGQYIAFLDSDDIWNYKKLELQVSYMLEGQLNFTSTNSFLIDENGNPLKKRAKNVSQAIKKYGIKSLLFKNTIVTSSVILERSFLSNVRFNESKNFIAVEDYFLWLNLLSKKECHFSHLLGQFVDYRVFPNSLASTGGKLNLALKGMMAATQFLVEKKQANLIYLILMSNIFRVFKLFITRGY